MKILLTGGGTGGHFYPIIAVAEEINEIAKVNRLLAPKLYYMSTEPYNEGLLFQNNIIFEKNSAGKIRRDMSLGNLIKNFFDLWKTFFGVLHAIWRMFVIYPDVVFSKGGYASFPAVFAARLLLIPVVIHESDSTPGKVNAWAGKFARKIAISYPDAIKYFKKEKTAYTGNPIRKEIQDPLASGMHEFFGLDKNLPTVFIISGSQGSVFVNEIIIRALPLLVAKYNVIHHTGKNNIKIIEETRDVVLQDNPNKSHYKALAYLNVLELRMASGAADVIISRGGSTIFEIASWAKPAIIVPIPPKTSHDQRSNAFTYARSGAAIVIEEENMSEGVLLAEIERILTIPGEKERMSEAAKTFARRDAAKVIAEELISIGLEHEK
jgi:UDP-N-acetylglucosamine--N-acetylmuramyl-(pentapeptide) pyrophosphoryl-undecaprenol N-acetylglucosamine transferase